MAKRVYELEALQGVPFPFRRACIALGTFDGVHLGHQSILQATVRRAAQRRGSALALTFDRHPGEVVGRGAPPLLTTLSQRLELFLHYGIDAAVVARFDETFSRLSAQNFIDQVLVDTLKAEVVVVGYNFRFGHRAAGNVQLLAEQGSRLGFETVVMPAVRAGGAQVSSTAIRRLLSQGDVSGAATLLGRDIEVVGTVDKAAVRQDEPGLEAWQLHVDARNLVPGPGVYLAGLAAGPQDPGVSGGPATTGEPKVPALVRTGGGDPGAGGPVGLEAFSYHLQALPDRGRITVTFYERLRSAPVPADGIVDQRQLAADLIRMKAYFAARTAR